MNKMRELRKHRIVTLPTVDDLRGSLTFVEGGGQVPFEIRRAFYLHHIPQGVTRAGHAMRTCEQLIVAVTGSFDAIVDDGIETSRVRLDAADSGLYLPPLTWLELENFQPGSVCLVLASEYYSDDAYIRTQEHFRNALGAPGG